MAADCAVELRKHNVACISLYPGAVRTETIEESLQGDTILGGDKVHVAIEKHK